MRLKPHSLGASVELRLSKIAHLTLIADETKKWAKVVQFSGAKPD
jgi:hypothetical protein